MALFTKITVFAKYSLKLCGFWSIVTLLEIYRVEFARAMYSSAFLHSAFLTTSGGRLIHGTDFTSDFKAPFLLRRHHSSRTGLDSRTLLRAGSLYVIRIASFFYDAQRGLFRCVDRRSVAHFFPFFLIRCCDCFARTKNAFAVELWKSVFFFLCFLCHLQFFRDCRLACSMVFDVQRFVYAANALFPLASLPGGRSESLHSRGAAPDGVRVADRKH